MKISDLKFDLPPDKETAPIPAIGDAGGAAPLETLWQELVRQHAGQPALVDDRNNLSFADVDVLSRSIANFILSGDYGPAPVVGVLCRRGAMVVAAGLGAMRAGATYLPVDRDAPLVRQEVMLQPARLLLTDRSCLREAEFLQYRIPGIRHVLCLDATEFDGVIEPPNELGRTAFWEHLASEGSDAGWRHSGSGERLSGRELETLAANVLAKSGLAEKAQRRVLDIGCGSGAVAQALLGAATHYTGVDLTRAELVRAEQLAAGRDAKFHQFEAIDICFLGDAVFDLICLNGVVESFPGYNYLRRVLDHAVARLAPDGVLLLGAVWDLAKKDALRAALREEARRTGDNRGLIRFDGGAELAVPERFFADWAAHSRVPVEFSISAPAVGCSEIADFRFDVTIRRAGAVRNPTAAKRLGTQALATAPRRALPEIKPDQAAYLVYTSGSTGVPKGVVEEHRHLLHFLRAFADYSEGCERAALFAPLTFDASIQQLAVSLFRGKPLHILSDEDRKSPEHFRRCVARHGIDLSDMTPAFFNVLVEHLFAHQQPLPMKRLLIAGEVLRPDSVRKFYRIPGNEGVVIFNVYGPTECTVDTTTFRLDHGNHLAHSVFPIGRPLAGTTVTIRDPLGRAVPDSVTGEIWISGAGVSRGYLNVDSSAAFVTIDGQRAYRSGDFGFIEKGLVYYLGREDQQVKIRGNRVEIGEVENAIAGYPGVRQVVVVAGAFLADDDKALAAYVVGEVDLAQLRSYLERLLPSWCVPGYFVPMSELPLTPNRKVDKKALPSPKNSGVRRAGRPLAGPLEEKLAAIWQKLLGVTVTDADADFFALGGHSILAVRLIATIEKELERNLTLSELFTHSTIGGLSELFTGKTSQDHSPVIRLCHREGLKSLFLFHPVGGSVFCYSELARLLSHRLNVYAVEAAGFHVERNVLNTEFHRVEDLAEYYLERILPVAGDNVIFGGWSFGGFLAYEAACRFEKLTGRPCGPALILDTLADNTQAKEVVAMDDVGLLKSLLADPTVFDEQKLRTLPADERLVYLVRCGEERGLLPVGFSSTQTANLLQTYRSNAVAAARYERPERTDKDILLIRAEEVSETTRPYIHDQYIGWRAFLPEERITLRWTGGSHQTMLSPAFAGGVARHIIEYLDHD